MERTEKIGLGLAGAGHLVLFGLLSVGFLATPNPETLKPQPISVTLSDEVALESAAPQSEVAPAQSMAPEIAPPEDAAPPAPSEVAEPEPAPPEPTPPPEPAPAPKPEPKPQPPKPKPTQAARQPREKPAQRPAKPQTAAKPAEKPPAKPAQGKSESPRRKPGGLVLGDDVFKGANDRPAPKSNVTAQAASISREALSGIIEAIRRQIQPCADRQVNPGPGANAIVVTLNLKLNRDGSLAGAPSLVGTTGVTDDNGRYRQRVIDLGIAAFRGCAPLELPAQYYQTANGGWGNINYKWQLR